MPRFFAGGDEDEDGSVLNTTNPRPLPKRPRCAMAASSTSSSSASPPQRLSHRLRCPSSSAAPPRARVYRTPLIVEAEEEFDSFPRPYGYISSETGTEDESEEEMREVPEPADSVSMTLTDPDVLKCPICLEPLCSPVFQCENGHIACDSCCTRIGNKCGSCSFPIGYNRCRAIEKVIESVKISCSNVQHGCTKKVHYNDKVNHEKTCRYAPCSCPYSGCTFVGISKCVYPHFFTEHANSDSSIIFFFNCRVSIPMVKEQKYAILQERVTNMLFILNRRNETFGSCFNITCLARASSKREVLYELTVKYADTSIHLKTVAECMPKVNPELPIKKFLIIPSDFGHSSGFLWLDVIISKPRDL